MTSGNLRGESADTRNLYDGGFSGIDEEFRRVCSATKGYFGFRNWYAHGRIRTMPVVPDPEDVYEAYEQLHEKVPNR